MALLLISHKALAALDVFAAHIPRVFREPAAVSGTRRCFGNPPLFRVVCLGDVIK